jgi:ribose 5-phosphate isomerase A
MPSNAFLACSSSPATFKTLSLFPPLSVRTKGHSESLDIPLMTLDTHSKIDVAIDGADGVDPELNLIDGCGGALFREKIVEVCTEKCFVVVDESKLVDDGLGPDFPIPVEIAPFCDEHTMRVIADLASCKESKPILRLRSAANNKIDRDEPAVTENGNCIADPHFDTPNKEYPTAMGLELKTSVWGQLTTVSSVVCLRQ